MSFLDAHIPSNGEEWHDLREGRLPKLDEVQGISESMKTMIKRMLDQDPDKRPTAAELLDHFVPGKKEIELRWHKIEHKLLLERQKALENMIQKTRTRRYSL